MRKLGPSDLFPLFVSIIALTVSLWQAHESRRHNRLSVTPKLNIEVTKNQRDGIFELVLKNQGVGPAIIESIELFENDKAHKVNTLSSEYWGKLLDETQVNSPYGYEISYEHIQKGYYVRPEEAISLLTIQQLDPSSWQDIEVALQKVIFIIHYRSIYEEDFQMPLDLSKIL